MRTTLLTCAAACLLAAGCTTAPTTATPAIAASTAAKPSCVGAPAASRIPQGGCSPGQTYSQDDIQSTGYPGSPAAALQTLDPLIHH